MSNHKKSNSIESRIGRLQLLIAGLKANMAGQTIVLGGKTYAVADVITAIEAYIAQLSATAAARAAWIVEVQTTDALGNTQMDPLVTQLHRYLEGTYGPSSQTLTSFGLTPRKIRPRTSKQKAASAAKADATRLAHEHGTVTPAEAPAAEPPASPTSSAPPVTPGKR
jgi:hypothetical protein